MSKVRAAFAASLLMFAIAGYAAQAAHASRASRAPAKAGANMFFDPANSWAVLVGIKTYDSPTHPTVGGDGDVAEFHTLLQQAGWDESHILTLTDQEATGDAIRSSFRWLVSHSNATTFSIFHYSGHVQLESGHTWLWGVDNNLIPEDEFGSAMQPLAGHAWIDISGCEAAAFDRGVSSSERFFTGSSMAHEKSYEEPAWGESVWTGFAVDKGMLQHQAGSGPLSIQAAVRWAQQQAPQYTSGQQPYGPQDPYAVGGDGEWFLTPNGATQTPAPPPSNPATTTTTAPPPDPPPNGCTHVMSVKVKCQPGSSRRLVAGD